MTDQAPESRKRMTGAAALLQSALEDASHACADAMNDMDRGDSPETALRRLKQHADAALMHHAREFKEKQG